MVKCLARTEFLKQLPGFPYPGIADEYVPMIASVDTGLLAQPWGPYFRKMYDRINDSDYKTFLHYDEDKKVDLFDSVMVGTLRINSSLMPYNPLLYERRSVPIDPAAYVDSVKKGFNGIFFTIVTKDTTIDGNPTTVYSQITPIDSVYIMDSYRASKLSTTGYIIDALFKKNHKLVMRDSTRIKQVHQELMGMITEGIAYAKFPQFEESDPAIN